MILETRGNLRCDKCGNTKMEIKEFYSVATDYNNKYDHMFNLTEREVHIICAKCGHTVFAPEYRKSVKLNFPI